MQKIVFLFALAILAISVTQAQLKPDFNKNKAKKAIPGTPAPPPPVNKTTPVSNAVPSVYSLTAVRVKIRTGNDNKEFPSKLLVTLKTKNASSGDWSTSNAYGFLNNDYRLMECVTDGSFAPLTAVIKKP